MEGMLYKPIALGDSQLIQPIDYMGGDATVERAATMGHGRAILSESVSQRYFFDHLVTSSIKDPFKFPQVKLLIQAPINEALDIVYAQAASLNEYSGRYSVMIDTAALPAVEFLASRMQGMSRTRAMDNAKRAQDLMAQTRQDNYRRYQWLVGKDVDFARELSRIPLELANDTRFIWKMDLLSLVNFIHEKRGVYEEGHSLDPYLDTFEQIARALAPEAAEALLSENERIASLTMPLDEEVIDAVPLPAGWEPSETARVTVPELEERLFVPVAYLDHGAIQVVDYMGGDAAPVDGARMSYGSGTLKLRSDQKLLDLLYRADHASPFELAELAIESKQPFFVSPRQAKRHRTLDSTCFMGEFLAGSQFYIPPIDELKHQDRKNRQGRGKELDEELREPVVASLRESYDAELRLVEELRELGVDEQTIRSRKGVGFYTAESRTGDLRNWLHFLGLRWDPHAQKEIFLFADAVADLVKRQSPTSFNAFVNYTKNGMKFSGNEKAALAGIVAHSLANADLDDINMYRAIGLTETKKDTNVEIISREGEEFKAKLLKLREAVESDQRAKEISMLQEKMMTEEK